MKKKGFVMVEVLVISLVTMLGTVLLWKPITSTLGIGNQPQKQRATVVRKVESQPVLYYTDAKGNQHVAMATKTYESTLDSSEDRVMSIWQKFKLWVILGLVAVIAFPSFGIWAFKRFLDMKSNLKQLVTGIEEAKKKLPTESVDILGTNLSMKMDQAAKTEVKKLKVGV